MKNKISDILISNIEQYKKNNIFVCQDGFIQNKFAIENINFKLENDILMLNSEVSDEFIKININQIYSIEMQSSYILIFMDNDTKIKIEIKK